MRVRGDDADPRLKEAIETFGRLLYGAQQAGCAGEAKLWDQGLTALLRVNTRIERLKRAIDGIQRAVQTAPVSDVKFRQEVTRAVRLAIHARDERE